jgi:GR25 family glycosyltransferase involved in LPS biosynthesis
VPLQQLIGYVLSVDEIEGVRRKNAERELCNIPLKWKYVDGLCPSDIGFDDEYSERLNGVLHKRSLTPPEICVYAGHRRAWRMLVDSDYKYALVLEDDFRILDRGRFMAAVEDIISASEPLSIFKFFDFKPKPEIADRTIGTSRWAMHRYAASGAVAYVLHRDAAVRLLARPAFFRAVDEDLSHPWEFGIDIWSLTPNAVAEISGDLDGSLLEADRRMARADRSALRSFYGNLLQGYKSLAAALHRRRIRHRLAR